MRIYTCMYTYIYIHICMCKHVSACKQVWGRGIYRRTLYIIPCKHTHTHIHTHTTHSHTHTHTHTHTHSHTHTHTYTHTHVCVCAGAGACVCVYIKRTPQRAHKHISYSSVRDWTHIVPLSVYYAPTYMLHTSIYLHIYVYGSS